MKRLGHSYNSSYRFMSIVLADHARDPGLDLLKVVTMLLIHDIVEIDAGDTRLYDEDGYGDKREREERAAERIFGILPDAQRDRFIRLWRESETGESPEAGLAAALDSMQPGLNHYLTDGAGIRRNELPESLVLEKKLHMERAAPELWAATVDLIRRSTVRGLYREG